MSNKANDCCIIIFFLISFVTGIILFSLLLGFTIVDSYSPYNCDITNSKLPFENDSVSAFFLFHVVEHIHDSNLIISECYRTLKKNGVLFIATPNWARQIKTFHEDPTHIRPFIKSGLSRLLRIHGWTDFQVCSFGTSFGLAKLKLYKIFPKLAFIGRDILAICIKD